MAVKPSATAEALWLCSSPIENESNYREGSCLPSPLPALLSLLQKCCSDLSKELIANSKEQTQKSKYGFYLTDRAWFTEDPNTQSRVCGMS